MAKMAQMRIKSKVQHMYNVLMHIVHMLRPRLIMEYYSRAIKSILILL